MRATVFGTDLYETAWQWNGHAWLPDCSCPIGGYCKHAFAVAACVINDHGTTAPAGSRAGAQQRFASTPHAPAWVAAVASARGDGNEQASFTRAAERTQPRRSTRREPPSPLDGLRMAKSPWQRQVALMQLLARAPVAWLGDDPALQTLLQEPDPDLLCWRLAHAVARRTGGWLPPALETYRDRPDLEVRVVERTRDALLDEVTRWAGTRRDAATRSLRIVLGLERDAAGTIGVTIEARLTSTRLVDAPRTSMQLQQLRSELHRTPGLLPPSQAGLLEWLTDAGGAVPYGPSVIAVRRISGTALTSFLGRCASPSFAALVSWSEDLASDLAAFGGIAPGAPVRFLADAARLVPVCVSVDGAPALALHFVWPDGRDLDLHEALWIRAPQYGPIQPSLVLAGGAFSLVVEEPPASLIDRFSEVGTMVLPAARRAGALALLAARFPHIAETVREHTRMHRVRRAVALDLRDDDWLQVRLFAHTGAEDWSPPGADSDGVTIFEYAPDGRWARRVAATAAEADDPVDASELAIVEGDDGSERQLTLLGEPADLSLGTIASVQHEPASGAGETDLWIEAPDAETVEPLLAWLHGTSAKPGSDGRAETDGLGWHDRHRGWWIRASRRQMEAFADAWEQRPSGVAYFGNARVRRLLADAPLATPHVRVHASGLDWLAVSADWEIEGSTLSDADLAKLRSATTRFVRLERGWVRREAIERHAEIDAMLADLGVEPGQGEQRITLWQLAGARRESLEALARMGAGEETVRALAELRERVAQFIGLPEVPLPAGFIGTLRPYQQCGLDFLVYTSSLAIGALLADDMGLGKTVQALAWLEHLRAAAPGDGPALVVCPASVVHNWAREAERFVPGLRVLLLTRGAARHTLRAAIPQHDLIVTTYSLLRRDVDEWRQSELRAVILDEAQNIKNPDAVVTRAALALRARHRLALTGTPLENRALDLWSIVSFVNPGYLGSRAQFTARFDRLDAPPHARMLLAAKLRPLLLRRMKQDVATDLPDRIEERRDCELTRGQRQLYLAELQRSRRTVAKLSTDAGALRQNKIAILAALTRLRQICCHPALAGGKTSLGSGKFDTLAELLEPILAEGHKVLLFSQFVQCLKLLRADLEARGVPCHLLTGATVRREAVVTAFSEDPRACVFLISLKAGGTGLNLTSASYVVLFDPWWNPAVEAQAIDRTHRIGQHRTVIAYRLLSLGTIEEKIWELQQRKAALARDILGEDGFARSLTRDDLQYLLADG